MAVAVVGPQGEESEALHGRSQDERTSGIVGIAAPPQAAAALVGLFSGMTPLIGITNISGAPDGLAEMP